MKKLVMIGCGGIGNYHLEHLLAFNDIELAGFCDPMPERAESFVNKAGSGKAFTDYKKMYDEIKPDMVFICVPPAVRGEIEFETIKRRIPFFIEKPVALSLDLAYRISDEVKKAGLITAVGFQCRYSSLVEPNVKFIKDKKIVFVDCIRIGGVPGADWWKKKSTSGGQIVEQTIHQLDVIRYVFDEPELVFTLGAKGFVNDIKDYDIEDLSTTVIRFKSGALGAIVTGCYAKSRDAADNKIVFGSRDSRAELRILDELKIIGYKDNDGNETSESAGNSSKSGGVDIRGYKGFIASETGEIMYKHERSTDLLCARTFIDAVITGDGSKIRSPYEDAVKSLEFAIACNRSIDTGLPVKIG